jgi:hypothetical protein
MSKKSTNPMDFTNSECFNCFKQGFCEKSMRFPYDPDRKPIHFCNQLCANVYIQDEITPKQLDMIHKKISLLTEIIEDIKKSDSELIAFKKTARVEKMLYTSLIARKPKTELQRLYALWQECATETLQQLGDDKDVQEGDMMMWAKNMKLNDKVIPSFIQYLGR